MNRRIDRVVVDDDRDAQDEPSNEGSEEKERPRRAMTPDSLRKWLSRVDGRFMGYPIELNPQDAIIWAMKVSAGEARYCEEQIARLQEDELFEVPLETTYVELPSGRIEQIQVKRGEEEMNRWVTWRDHALSSMAKYAKMALDAGIDERQMKLAEHTAHQIVNTITAVLVDLGHDMKDVRTRDIVRRRLMEASIVDTTATPIGDKERAVA